MIMNIASFGYYWRFARKEFNVLKHVIIPILGVAAFVFPFLAGLGLAVVSFIAPLTPPISYAGPVVIGLYVVELVVVIYHWQAHPDRVIAMGNTLADDGSISGEVPPPIAIPGVVPG